MDQLEDASKVGNLDGLYEAIRKNPSSLVKFEQIPFVNTPLHIAAHEGHIEFSTEIMRLMPSFAKKPNQDGWSPMHLALHQGHTQFVLWLIELDSQLIRLKGREGITPLHYVVQHGNANLLSKFLLVCPQSIEDLTIRKETALHIALKNDNFEVFKDLIDSLLSDFQDEDNRVMKKILNSQDLDGNNLLHIVSSRNQHQALDLLLKCNKSYLGVLELNALNNNSLTALDIAYNLGNSDFQKSLEHAGAEKASTLNSTAPPTTRLRSHKWNFTQLTHTNILREFHKFYFAKTHRIKTSDLLVVAVLMATTTFEAGLSPPGGIHEFTGIATLASQQPFSFIIFMVFNCAGFILSLYGILVLVAKHPLFLIMWLAVPVMLITYFWGIISITPHEGWLRILLVPACCLIPLLIALTSPFINLLLKRRKRN